MCSGYCLRGNGQFMIGGTHDIDPGTSPASDAAAG